ncbi:hypothetical protein SAMN05428642_103491 [Flaviramulus basaltis]|uniref:Beta-1,6-galactofuranosyltransferase n=1 Tax=Flaviramulus basaltis TaxID=369401 RepID=A0A1K2INP6_9FLAO|nr:hypothetical protein [Flaviramulus basaltis]SFZ93991.1 hypothetical protein SAMN05428642_103491 [Flaviramulus basaltis]
MYYISKNYKSVFNASGKAKTDFEYVLKEVGFKNLGFKQSSIPNSVVGAIKNFMGITIALIRLPFKSILFTQYPVNKYRKYIVSVAQLKKCKTVTIVHDVSFLRKRTKNKNAELDNICKSDAVVVHNPTMKQWFLDQGVKIPVINLELFDYVVFDRPTQNDAIKKVDTYSLVYAGGYGGNKNSYVYDVDKVKTNNFNLKLYGKGFDSEKRIVPEKESLVLYEGAFPADKIPYKIIGDFGLVWDGNSVETCSGQYGEYLKFNNPHKTSLYLLCGLPLIIWKEAALAPFVQENNLGITISSLEELNDILEKLDFEDYKKIKENVLIFQKKVMSGEFGKAAIKAALKHL